MTIKQLRHRLKEEGWKESSRSFWSHDRRHKVTLWMKDEERIMVYETDEYYQIFNLVASTE